MPDDGRLNRQRRGIPVPMISEFRRQLGSLVDNAAAKFVPTHWISKGRTARAAGNWAEAARYFQKDPRARHDLAEAWVIHGDVLSQSGSLAEAESAYLQAIAALPHHPTAHVQLGHLTRQRGDVARAAQHYADGLRRNRNLSDVAKLLQDLGFAQEVMEILDGEDRYPLDGQIESHFWWHSIDLGGGLVTSGWITLNQMAERFVQTFSKFDLNGKSVVDFGAWNGAFSVEASRRGASRVVAVDHFTWNHPVFRGRQTFDLVNRVTGLAIEAKDIDLDAPQLSLKPLGQFDIVLFLGVFYHLRDPLAALREISSLAVETLVVETHVERTSDPRPAMIFYPRDELNGDPTNWWGPNRACMTELLRQQGFARIEITSTGADRAIFHAYRD